MSRTFFRSVSASFLSLLLVFSLMGCSTVTHSGGDTTCEEFAELDSKLQKEVIRAVLAEGGNDNPSNGEVTLIMFSAKAYCATAGTPTSPMRNING